VTADLTVADTATITVSPSTRAKLLRLLVMGKGLDDAAVDCGLPDTVAHAVASGAGWPNLARVGEVLGRPVGAVEVPVPREPEPDPEPAEPAEPGGEDHPAVERVRALTGALRDRDTDAVAALAGAWTPLETFEVACLAAVLARGDLGQALEVLDLPAGEWSAETVAGEAARWDAGDRDATAEAGRVERDRRGS
jgi:hypothetical protein